MKVTVKGWLYQVQHSWETEPSYRILSIDNYAYGDYSKIQEVCVDIDIPDDFDPRPAKIAALQKVKTDLQADFGAKMNHIDRQIADLLAITNEAK